MSSIATPYSLDSPPQCLVQSLHPSDSFWRAVTWAPDGGSILAQDEQRRISIYALPDNLLNSEITPSSFTLYRSIPSPSSLLAATWFPSASSSTPETYCFMRSIRDAPLHLVDGISGQIRASYPIIDHTERFIGPHSMAFSVDGSTLYAGHENAIELIDIASPGQPETRMPTTPNRKSKDGQKGIISAIAVSPHDSSLLAAASYTGTVAVYDLDSERMTQMWQTPGGGATQVVFHPASRETLIVASRLSSDILCYDLRNTSIPYRTLDRGRARTNQRLNFSLDAAGRYLAAGDKEGSVRIFGFDTDSEDPLLTFRPHQVASASLHPYLPLLLTCSGSRFFDRTAFESDGSGTEEHARAGAMSLYDLGCSRAAMQL